MYDETPSQPVLTSHERNKPRGKQHFNVQNPPRRENRDSRPLNLRSAGKPGPRQAPPKQKFAGFCHDQMLKAYKGTQLTLVITGNGEVDGKLIDVDRYTLVVETTHGRELIFKHALVAILLPQAQ